MVGGREILDPTRRWRMEMRLQPDRNEFWVRELVLGSLHVCVELIHLSRDMATDRLCDNASIRQLEGELDTCWTRLKATRGMGHGASSICSGIR